MTDYLKGVGNGTMMIRDVGNNWVEFWFQTGSSTYNNDQIWGYQANGAYIEQKYRLARGGAWQMLGSVYIVERQNILFRIFGAGLGWGTTDFFQFIERAREPDPPYPPRIWEVTTTQIHSTLDYGYDGGMGIDNAEIWYSDDPNVPKWIIPNTRDTWISNLVPGVNYWVWGKAHNPIGWSGFSASSYARTIRQPDAPSSVYFSNVRQNKVVIDYNFDGRWDGGTPIREWQVGYGLDPNAPQAYLGGVAQEVAGLSPGQRYYFWARGRNDVGWGPWSVRSDVLLVAGAWVKSAGVWRRALPYERAGGTWKLAQPWTKAGGTWRNVGS